MSWGREGKSIGYVNTKIAAVDNWGSALLVCLGDVEYTTDLYHTLARKIGE